jgi:hypothetical protein
LEKHFDLKDLCMWQNKSLEETAAEEVLEECGYSISPSKLGKNTFLYFLFK